MQRAFNRLAIVNRGEPAMRVINAVRELNRQREEPIRLIALYTEPEREAMFVRRADEAVCVGPGTVENPDGTRKPGYLDYPALERALRAARADAAWVGWGLVAEHPEFADLCERLSIVFVGPDAAVMRHVGDKIEAKRLAEEAGVPVAPWSGGPVASAEAALRQAADIGFPLMVKATAGGGGRGIRRVDAPDELPSAIAGAQAEALQAFGDGTVLLERLIAPARHVEVQIIADGQGAAWAVGLRDCSCQRGNQKVIEESASPALDPEQEREALEAARRLALRAGYRGAGTVEFLYEPDEQCLSFIGVKACLQVEHPVTEAVTGVDLVKLQLHVATGGRLEGQPPPPHGHAIEARVNAEDPERGFVRAPGPLALLRLPTGPGVRVDTGVAEGDVIAAEFDSTIAKIIAWGRDRDEALARLHRALSETMIVVDGGTTNQGFLLALLERPELRSGDIDMTWLDRLHVRGETVPARHADIALLQAAIVLSEAETAADRARFYAYARRGRPQAGAGVARTVDLRHRGQAYRLSVAQHGPGRHCVSVDGNTIPVAVHRLSAYEHRLEVDGHSHRTLTSLQGPYLLVEVDGVPHRISHDDGGLVRNLAPALVVSIPVAPGDEVEHGDVVAVVESMKMESSLTAPFRGRVREVLAGANVQVPAQAPLVRLEPLGDATAATANGSRVSFPASPPEAAAPGRCRDNLQRLEWLVLGYDIAEPDVARTISDLHGECADLSCDPALLPGEHRLLERFADLRALTRPGHDETDDDAGLVRSPQEHLHAYLRSLDPEAEGLPPGFVALLERALGHYGVESLDRTPALEAACYRIFLAQERAATARAAVLAILDRRLELAGDLAGRVGNDFRQALDRLVGAMEGRDPVVADLARDVRFRYFDEPLIAETRDRTYAAMDRHLEALADDPERADRDQRIARARRVHAPARPADRRAHARRRPGAAARAAGGRDAALLPRAHAGGLHRGAARWPGPAHGPLSPRRAAAPTRDRLRRARPVAGRERRLRRVGGRGARGRRRRRGLLRLGRRRASGRGTRRATARGALPHAPAAVRSPDRGHRRRAGARPRHGGGHAVHVPPDAGRPGRGRRAPRSAPDDVPPPRAGAPLRLRAEAAAVGRGRVPVPRRGARRREGRAAVRARRGARPHAGARRRRASRRRYPSSSACSGRRSRASAASRPTASRAAARSGTGSCCMSGPPSSWRRRRSGRSSGGSPRRPPASASRCCSSRAWCAIPTAASASVSCVCSRRPAPASSSRSTSGRRLRWRRSTSARSGSSPRAAAAPCIPQSSSSCSTARSSSTTSTSGET